MGQDFSILPRSFAVVATLRKTIDVATLFGSRRDLGLALLAGRDGRVPIGNLLALVSLRPPGHEVHDLLRALVHVGRELAGGRRHTLSLRPSRVGGDGPGYDVQHPALSELITTNYMHLTVTVEWMDSPRA